MGPAPADVVAAGYDAAAERYAALEAGEEWPRLRWVRALLSLLPDGSTVLELGCGNGLPATAELARRHRVLGVDVSGAQIRLARANVPAAEFLQADAAGLDLPAESLDAVVSLYALGHIPRDEHAGLLGRIAGWLRPGGLLLLSEEDADRPDVVEEWLGVPMFFSSWDAATLATLVAEAGFELVRERVEAQLEQGRPVPFAWILARRAGG